MGNASPEAVDTLGKLLERFSEIENAGLEKLVVGWREVE